jgi:hypothetical protein
MQLTFAETDITQKFETIAPSQARHLLATTAYEHQREIDWTYVKEYGMAMRRGEFRPGSPLEFAVYQGNLVQINGRHSLEAVVWADLPHVFSIVTYTCTEAWQVHALYLTYDRNRLRSLDQLYAAYGFPQQHNFNKAQVKRLGATMPLLAAGFAANATSRNEVGWLLHSGPIRIDLMTDWVSEATAYCETVKGAPAEIAKLMGRASIFAVAMVTYRYTGADAAEFWHNVAWDDNLAYNDPQKALNRFIREHTTEEYEHHVYARYVAAAWNAAWKDRTLLKIQPWDSAKPILLEGTPHDGTQTVRYLSPDGVVQHDPVQAAAHEVALEGGHAR